MMYHKLMLSNRGDDDYLDILYEAVVENTKAKVLAEARRKELERERAIRDEMDAFYAKQFDEQELWRIMGMEEAYTYESYESYESRNRKSK